MARLWILSDLHQEFVRDPDYRLNPLTAFDPAAHAPSQFDAVVLAGDVSVPLSASLRWAAERFAGVPTIYVPGNHDFYVPPGDPARTIGELQDEGRERADHLGVHLLTNSTVKVAATRFIGATLWTDFRLGRGTYQGHIGEARSRHGMNDYRRIKRWSTTHTGKRKPLRPEDTIAFHNESRRFIADELARPANEATVVVTHHAPLAESVPSSKDLIWCYASRLDEVLAAHPPDLWVHGHIHRAVDYLHGRTRIVSNPRGYAFLEKSEHSGFNPGLVVEVASPTSTG